MDKDFVLRVADVGAAVTLSAGTTRYEYQGVKHPNHTCNEPRPLQAGDVVIVQNLAPNKDVLVKGPCGCNFFLYDLVVEPAN
jgi:hypothetical protein